MSESEGDPGDIAAFYALGLELDRLLGGQGALEFVRTQAREAAATRPRITFASAEVGDARALRLADASADAVLLLGPLYHLPERAGRLKALAEARRVRRPGAMVLAAAISRLASTLDGLRGGYLADPSFSARR
jgi:SAM-dependent methyltransferase